MVEKKATKEVCLAMLDGKLDMLDLKRKTSLK